MNADSNAGSNADQAVHDALREMVLLSEVDDAGIRQLAALGSLQVVGTGRVLFAEGDRHSRLYFVVAGAIRLDMLTARCGTQPILSVGTGDILAWSALVGDGLMTATAIVTEDALLAAFEARDLQRVLEQDPKFGYQFMRVVAQSLSRRLLATRLQLLDLFHKG